MRNVGEGLVHPIVREREDNGPFTDFYDFCERVDSNVLNKRAVESLIKAGAFDSLGHPRQGLLAVHEAIVDRTMARRRKEAEGQFELFASAEVETGAGFDDARIEIPDLEFEKRQRLAFEKEMLGLYVSDHPLMGAEASLRRRTECLLTELEEAPDGAIRVVGGLVTALQRKWTKRGDLMAVFQLEDLQTSIEVMVFPKTMQKFGHVLVDDAIVIMKGRVDTRDDQPKLMATEVERFEPIVDGAPPVRINLSPERAERAPARRPQGPACTSTRATRRSSCTSARRSSRLPDQFCVDASNGLMGELRVLLGADAMFA